MKLNIDWTKVDSRYKYAAMDYDEKVFLYTECPSPAFNMGFLWGV